FTQQSGKWRGKERIQGGRELARAKLFMAAFNVVQHNQYFKTYFERLKSKGKPYKVAMVAVMRKLLCVCNALVKNKTNWDPCLT
ncbi:MAG TPA: transposase, partial [Aridibacter sp.]|nr:transposase [Aridibacter sp.]